MKKFYILALVAAMFAACSTDVTEDVAIEAPETLKVSFEESSRIQLDDNKTVWTKGDLVSVFYRSDANQQWKFQGNTGDRSGTIKRISTPEYSHTTSKMVVAYPYNENYYLNPETCNLQAYLPAEQTYLKDSYGINGNIMVSQSEYKQFVLKSVCGWLKIQLTGNGEKVQSIKLKGNNGEQVAGEIYVNTADATSILAAEMGFSSDHTQVGGTMVEDDTILTEVTLDCGEGATLGSESAAFYIALPPQEFSKGLTVEITDTKGETMKKTTNKVLTIERNHILPMEAFLFITQYTPTTTEPASNEIWYTSYDGEVVHPKNTDAFGSKIISNTYTNGLGVISFEKEISKIGDQAFMRTNLTKVILPNGIKEIGIWAFGECSYLSDMVIPNGVIKLGAQSFRNCPRVKKVIIPNTVTEIGDYAFHSCSDLESVTMSDNIRIIGSGAFSGCGEIKEFKGKCASLDNRCLIIDNKLVAFAANGLTSYSIQYGIKTIGGDVFYGCWQLENIYIPNSVTQIESGAFMWAGISSINIPNGVVEISSNTFNSCTNLTSVTIPNSVELISNDAFFGCTSLTSITIPESVTSISSSPFGGCDKLAEFKGKYASEDGKCLIVDGEIVAFAPYGVIGYNIPDGVTSIGYDSFRGNTTLKSIVIPESVKYIAAYVFQECSNLSNVYCASIIPPHGEVGMFDNNASGRKIYVPRASVDAYKAAEYWSDYKSSIEPYDFE